MRLINIPTPRLDVVASAAAGSGLAALLSTAAASSRVCTRSRTQGPSRLAFAGSPEICNVPHAHAQSKRRSKLLVRFVLGWQASGAADLVDCQVSAVPVAHRSRHPADAANPGTHSWCRPR